jgi:hypothetical protein
LPIGQRIAVPTGPRARPCRQPAFRREESAAAALARALGDDGLLTALDRCGARAYVRVLLPSRLELLFCAHHNRQYASALAKITVEIHDETRPLARTAA